jgi:hypothetical protein
MIGRCVVVVGEKNMRSKDCRRLTLDLAGLRHPTIPQRLVVVFLGLTVMQVIHKRAEDCSLMITSHAATLNSRIQHGEIGC